VPPLRTAILAARRQVSGNGVVTFRDVDERIQKDGDVVGAAFDMWPYVAGGNLCIARGSTYPPGANPGESQGREAVVELKVLIRIKLARAQLPVSIVTENRTLSPIAKLSLEEAPSSDK